MAGGGNEVEHHMDTVVPESRVTLDTRLLGQNVVVLSLEVADNLCEASAQCQYGSRCCAKPLVFTLPRYRSRHRNRACRQSSGRCEYPPRRAQALSRISVFGRAWKHWRKRQDIPTVTGLILTPSSGAASLTSSLSLCLRTSLPQSVLTNVVRPNQSCKLLVRIGALDCAHWRRIMLVLGRWVGNVPVPEAPQTIRQN